MRGHNGVDPEFEATEDFIRLSCAEVPGEGGGVPEPDGGFSMSRTFDLRVSSSSFFGLRGAVGPCNII